MFCHSAGIWWKKRRRRRQKRGRLKYRCRTFLERALAFFHNNTLITYAQVQNNISLETSFSYALIIRMVMEIFSNMKNQTQAMLIWCADDPFLCIASEPLPQSTIKIIYWYWMFRRYGQRRFSMTIKRYLTSSFTCPSARQWYKPCAYQMYWTQQLRCIYMTTSFN